MAVSFGKYELLRKIASGGMGQVFLARERAGVERLVVLKLILPHLAEDDEFLNMFVEEARLVGRLRHPNLVTILDLLEIEGRQCLAMEYVQGDDLRRVDKQARLKGQLLPPGLVLRIISEAAAGLDYAHRACDAQGQPLRLVHRDVSPQNVLVGFDGGVKIIDFGVAKAAGSSQQTATGVLKGKYPYMSPEQASGQAIDGRSDQFALGVVLWELLTGKRLFKGETDLMTLRLVKDCQVPFPSQLNPKLPPGLDEVVMRALDANPQKRFPDCGAFRLALEDYIIQMRLQASGAHLAAYLRGLYAERISLEEDPTALDQLSEDSDLDSKGDASRSSHRSGMPPPGTPSRSPGHRGETRSRRAVDALVGPAPTPRHEPPPARGTVSLAALPPSSSRFPKVAVVVGGAVTLLLAGTAVVFLRPLPSEGALPPKVAVNVPPPPPEARPVPPPPPPTVPPRAPQPVQLVLASEPQGAQVHVDGTALGKTPRTLTLAPDAPPVQVTVTLEGYESATRAVSAADGPTVQVALERRAAATGPKAPPVKKPPAPPSLGIKTGR